MRVSLRIVLMVVLSACAIEAEEMELTPFEELQWPEPQPAPACSPSSVASEPPTLAAPSGSIRIDASSPLVPVAARERIILSARLAGGDIDSNASGALEVLVEGGEVLEVSAMSEGRAEAVISFASEGHHDIVVALADSEHVGSAELVAFATQSAIWELSADVAEFEDMLASPYERKRIAGQLQIEGASYALSMRVHGGASRDFPKKSLRLDLDDSSLPTGEAALILRAEYNDKSMLRTYLGYELFRNGTTLPTPERSWVHLRVNDRYYGLMHRVSRIDASFLERQGLSRDSNLYEADPPSELAVPGGSLQVLDSESDYYRVYQWHAGPGAWRDLIAFIEDTLTLPEEAFRERIADEVDLDSYLSYLAMMAVMQNHEHIRKNYYLLRDAAATDDRWRVLPWDLDLTLGHLWTPEDDVLSEVITSDGDLFVGEYSPERFGYYNQLADRVLAQPELRQRFLEIVAHYLDSVFATDFVDQRLRYARCAIAPDVFADDGKWASDDEWDRRIDEIREFVDARRAFIVTTLEDNGLR